MIIPRKPIGLPCLAVLAASFLAAAGPANVTRVEVDVRDRQVIGADVVRVTRGARVEMTWTSDEAASLHLHGYDIEFELHPGEPTALTFDAHATGRFPVTSHGFGSEGHDHETLLYVEVYPD